MRHRKAGRKLGRTTAHREMLLRNLLTSLFHYEKIVTTEAKAKELRKLADKVITLAKRGDLHARRQAAEVVQGEDVLKKLFDSIGSRYKDRNGGYTRLTKLEYRMGDGAPLAAIELAEVGAAVEPSAKPAKRRSRRGDKGKAPKPKPAEPLAAQPSGA
ncbi:50S ribosomal protein L17 [Candidatus Methylomirabilis lanthanidiphila]|uniref:Large ribosomal subunit protein bL17 n=1 Tax=Candidatus Methylomirabilis lanthanidiphila TaxID=2211376 RepID=A0A564ZGI1_9BACT|nr:50S ribosomal protein L17 [Candidatus Methylomirabilis lanthanidiphila]VUZ84429.1 50S ribosomal protein L17 [Candidatus Methylomirabilis lanthanidiphila]